MALFSLQANEIAKVLGYYEIGGVPTLLDSRIAAVATVVHEQMHRDNINSSFYGYVATRCLDFAALGGEPAGQLSPVLARASFEQLMRGAWNVLEGTAVAADYATRLKAEPRLRLKQFEAELPASYKAALRPFRPFIRRFYGNPEPIAFLPWMLVMLAAAAEVALDLAFLRRQSVQPSFDDWRAIAASRAPDEVLGVVALSAARLDQHEITSLAPPTGQLAGDALTVASRQMVVGVKRALLRRLVQDAAPSSLTDDHVKAALVADTDRALVAATPGLRGRVFLADRYAGFALQVPIRHQPTSLPFRELDAEDFEARLRTWDENQDIGHLVLWPVKRLDEAVYEMGVLPIVTQGQRLDAVEEFGFRGLSREGLLAACAAGRGGKLVWFNRFFPDVVATPANDLSPYDAVTLFQLQPPPYLLLPSFSADWLVVYGEARAQAPRLQVGRFAGVDQWFALRASFADHHLFWLLSGLDIADHESITFGALNFERAPFSEDAAFCAVALAALRGWGASDEQ